MGWLVALPTSLPETQSSSWARCTSQKSDEIGTVLRRLHLDTHPLARNQRFRVGQPAIEGGVRPDDFRAHKRYRIGKIWHRTGLPAVHTTMLRANTVFVQGMTGDAAAFIELLPAAGIP